MIETLLTLVFPVVTWSCLFPVVVVVVALPVAYQVVFGFAGAAVLAILGIYIEEMVFFFRRLYNWKPKDKAKWILGIYPVISQ